VLDAGALVAIDRGDRRVGSMIELAARRGLAVRTSAAVVAQVWRDGARQARLARLVAGLEVRILDMADARAVGQLLALTSTRDVVDAHVALVVRTGDHVLTSDPGDLGRLLEARGVEATVLRA
jgi:hypothetical protein